MFYWFFLSIRKNTSHKEKRAEESQEKSRFAKETFPKRTQCNDVISACNLVQKKWISTNRDSPSLDTHTSPAQGIVHSEWVQRVTRWWISGSTISAFICTQWTFLEPIASSVSCSVHWSLPSWFEGRLPFEKCNKFTQLAQLEENGKVAAIVWLRFVRYNSLISCVGATG